MKDKKTSKTGRPVLPENEKLVKMVASWLTKDEYRLFLEIKDRSGHRTMSEFIKHSILYKKRVVDIMNPVLVIEQLDKLSVAINRVGNNVNQIAKRVNSRGAMIDEALMQNYIVELEEYQKDTSELKKLFKQMLKKIAE